MNRTCKGCGCDIVESGTDAFDRTRWVTESTNGENRHCLSGPYPNAYHEPQPLVPDLTSPDDVRRWLVV